MSQNEKSKKDNLKNAMCYIPFVAIFLFFTETKRSKELNKNIKYGFFLLVAYMILMLFLGWAFSGFLAIVYVGISCFLGYKAYNGEEVTLEVFDELEETVKNKINDNKKEDTEK